MSCLARVRSPRIHRTRSATRVLFAVLAVVLVGGVSACGGSGGETSAGQGPATATLADPDPVPIGPAPTPQLPATVPSFDGGQVTVTDASRIVAVDRYGTLAQTVWALGLGGNLVGRASAAPPAMQHITNVAGGNGSISVEAVAAQRPTVFLTDTVTVTPTLRDQLRALGITVVFFDPQRTLDGVVPQIQAVAAALGVPAQGDKLAQRTRDEIASATAAVGQHEPKPKIAFLYLRSTAITMMGGPGSGADALIGALGGVDAGTAAGLKEPFVPITSEAMIAAAPDVFLVMSDGLASIGGVDGLAKVPGIAQTPAGRSKRVVDMSDKVLLSFGPNTGRVLSALTKALHGTQA
ncbi:ABC transporter substrate-binding protein [Nocardia sp. CDC159]|uniref:ABC transporter substrate-binding protein n=1 Tax=Nocardia pulmonis TaxID=2951408 RepID=A0A9X2E1G2_9NOCA|nr:MULTISPECIES: ABC transporter substrate-binding protein [Nocardia]MCM6772467.1 ABC transporter substrate-binding protein [Nocardia pulmonis]MCM6784875.1 ABC transporter substrate-binding protein [Nocardia sp. CDC159]